MPALDRFWNVSAFCRAAVYAMCARHVLDAFLVFDDAPNRRHRKIEHSFDESHLHACKSSFRVCLVTPKHSPAAPFRGVAIFKELVYQFGSIGTSSGFFERVRVGPFPFLGVDERFLALFCLSMYNFMLL